jgi:hypothetical protein
MPRTVHRVVAACVFLYALVIYLLTVSPTASFWDSGEFIAIAHGLQVSHPPGAPLYMLIGRLFSMFVPAEYVSLSVNLVSVVSSALTILLTHLVIVRLVRYWQAGGAVGPLGARTRFEDVVALVGGVVGACAFAVTDSFWFNAVEAEVYAGSMLFTALVVWLILRWSDIARAEEAQFKQSGNHPFGLQANRYLILIAYLFGLAIGMHLLNLLAVFFVALIFYFTEYEKPTWSTTARVLGVLVAGGVASVVFLAIYPGIIKWLPSMASGSGVPLLFMLLVFAAAGLGVWWSHTRGKQAFNLVMLCVTVVLIGYSTYGVIFIRSAANPPIDENDPETAEAIVSYLKREQYGATPRFPRMWSEDPNHRAVYARYSSELDFFVGYQVNYMYWRYFLWQFMGRDSDEQGAPAITGIDALDNALVDGRKTYFQTPSERASRNGYFALPLLLGLFGMLYHAVRDPRRAFAVFVLFFITGIGIILYLNQTPLQPRERDYSYVASFFAFSLWIGIGATGLAELAGGLAKRARVPAALGVGAVAFAAVPLVMLVVNYDDHDRSGRYVAPDYAYNMLNSTEPNAILFTNGDNDTFPLWYAQEVEGVRRDVRVANLSLLQTPWYIRQLKNQYSRESAPLPMTMNDEQVDTIGPVRWEPRVVELPVDSLAFARGSEMSAMLPGAADPNARFVSPMQWELRGREFAPGQYYLGPNDLAILDMLQTNARQGWERPIYFAVTVAPSGMLDLQPFFQLEGQANRVVPIRHNQPVGRVVPEITVQNLKNFRFRGLDDPDVYFDDNIRAMVDNYRSIFAQTALALIDQDEPQQARELLDFVLEKIPFETIPGDAQTFTSLARAYIGAGAPERAVEVLMRGEDFVLAELEAAAEGFGQPGGQRAFEWAAQSAQIMQLHYVGARAFDRAAEMSERIATSLGDPTYVATADEMREQYDFVIRQLGFAPDAGPSAES